MDQSTYFKHFAGFQIPTELQSLWEFNQQIPDGKVFCEGFWLTIDEQNFMLKTYSTQDAFLSSFVCIAEADGTGSLYYFWINEGKYALKEAPIIVFGSEGGYFVVAQNIRELLQILAFDVEPTVSWEKIYYYKDDNDYLPTDFHFKYKKWLNENYQLDAPEEADQLVANAQRQYQEDFYNWMRKYINT